ncbi:MucB/RseB C-terminal domain-containing protein [Marinomonas posidonica]|uniref:Sigma E regulatory protein, MucB/RseB n=1 Tax=Marinomonas posidonica (strain CECT 7376 / NCIMB 14433 / IVIA-Po-181) TaxID=491952 RepID=F6CYU2_MARPP|nr:MucB/RseB C-terminal domain-containing protein [Marinomonas posidonica]AEF55774.1 sigma E regulatory protein, MucB/RseB [Marinomonas posidonica IVIA-Po-181]
MKRFPVVIRCLSLCLLCFAQWSIAAVPTLNAVELLRQMTQSFHYLNYDGVFVHSEASNMNGMRIRHIVTEGMEYESLVDLDGDKVEVVRIDDKITCVYPDDQMNNRYSPFKAPFKSLKKVDEERLAQGYQLTVNQGQHRIAGRQAIIVSLLPRDEYRYGHAFWLDKENHFLLKHDVFKPDGQLLERVQFTSVNFTPDLKQEDFVPNKGTHAKKQTQVLPQRVKNLWRFEWLPEGFHLVWPEARALNHGTSMLLLSDGMATVSVFVEPSMSVKPISIMGMGATMAGVSSFKVKDQLYLLTIMGEVPGATIEKLMTVFMPRLEND